MRSPATRLVGAAAGTALVLLLAGGGGCQDATQVTLEIDLQPSLACAEVAGTTITVGAESVATEARVGRGDITTETVACDPATRRIGTLVVTPGESGRGAVVVVVGVDGRSAKSCVPPRYEGCIVARRRFSFSESTSLRMPITIDRACIDVSCDPSSTCRAGACFVSEVAPDACPNGVCDEPGELPNGGTSDASVVPDTGTQGDGGAPPPPPNPPSDGGLPATDAGEDIGPGDPLYCDPINIRCYQETTEKLTACASGSCCDLTTDEPGPPNDFARCSALACAGSTRTYCCTDDDCPQARPCVQRVGNKAGRCAPEGFGCIYGRPYCGRDCPLAGPGGSVEACCSDSGNGPEVATCGAVTRPECVNRYCCTDADCGVGVQCQPAGGGIGRCGDI